MMTPALDDARRADMRQRLLYLGMELDDCVRRFYAAGLDVPAIAARTGLEVASVRAAITGWASTQARVENARRRAGE